MAVLQSCYMGLAHFLFTLYKSLYFQLNLSDLSADQLIGLIAFCRVKLTRKSAVG